MRLPLKLLVVLVFAIGCAAGTAVPAALAAGSTTGTSSAANPVSGFGLGSAEANQATTATETTTVPVTSTSTSSSGGLSGLDAVLIAAIAVVILGGISLFVWRDARGHARRVGHGGASDPTYGGRTHPGSKPARKPRKPKPAERKRRKRGRAR
jgi:hypothetical protein